MFKKLCFLLLGGLFLSCSHHHTKDAHHHHVCKENCPLHKKNFDVKFDRKCAESIAEGDTHVEGSEEYKIEHAGNVYFFSSKEKMEKFNKNLEKNVDAANTNWTKTLGPKDKH